jgi:aminoglycoside phosphotransferase (APT) family kinase protein
MALVYHEMIVDALADLHSQFWDHSRLQAEIEVLTRHVPGFSFRMASQHFAAFSDLLGDRLSATRRGTYENILGHYPRYRPSGPKTLVHGDAHWGNFLYPYDPATHNLYLIDWAVWHVNHGVGDLAYHIALQCIPERRAWSEQPLVRRYHDRLLANGIHNYAWEDCWQAYRRMVIEQCLWPIVWHHFRLSPHVWRPALECTLAAFEDLHCEEFL